MRKYWVQSLFLSVLSVSFESFSNVDFKVNKNKKIFVKEVCFEKHKMKNKYVFLGNHNIACEKLNQQLKTILWQVRDFYLGLVLSPSVCLPVTEIPLLFCYRCATTNRAWRKITFFIKILNLWHQIRWVSWTWH